MLKYLGCSVALGLLGGLSSLSFMLIARHIAVKTRQRAFRAIIKQARP